MRLTKEEYTITDDAITISKKALEDWRKHYKKVTEEDMDLPLRMYYAGMADALLAILKHFDKQEL